MRPIRSDMHAIYRINIGSRALEKVTRGVVVEV